MSVRTSITTLLAAALLSSALQADINVYSVGKQIAYTQDSAAQPTEARGWAFVAGVANDIPDEVLTATVSFNRPPLQVITMTRATSDFHYYVTTAPSEAELDALYPSTTYTITAVRVVGPGTGSVFLPDGLYSPQIPFFTGTTYGRLQDYDPALPFNGTINGFTPAAGTNRAATTIAIDRPMTPSLPGARMFTLVLESSDTAFAVPADTLDLATEYVIGVYYGNSIWTEDAGFVDASSSAGFTRVSQVRFTTLPHPCVGDLDGSGSVDLSDLAMMLSNFGTPGGATADDGDLDGDGDVDLSDLAKLLSEFGTVCP